MFPMRSFVMKRVLILAFSDLHRDPRVLRQIAALKDAYQVTACGLTDPRVDGIAVHLVPGAPERPVRILHSSVSFLRFITGCYDAFYWTNPAMRVLAQQLSQRGFDLVIANDEATLPLALAVALNAGSKVLFDAHEYALEGYARPGLARMAARYARYIYRRYAPMVNRMTTVSDGIASEYGRTFGLSPVVVTNAPFYEPVLPVTVNPCRIRLIHHGICARDRELHTMFALLDLLDDRFTLDLMLVPTDAAYYRQLVKTANGNPKINILQPVPTGQIPQTIHTYDIGLFMLPGGTINQKYVLPNKLFEFIQGRLAVAIWPSPDMARIVQRYSCGIVSDSYTVTAMAQCLNALSSEAIWDMKLASDRAANDLCAEKNAIVLHSLVKELLVSNSIPPDESTLSRASTSVRSEQPEGGSEACVG